MNTQPCAVTYFVVRSQVAVEADTAEEAPTLGPRDRLYVPPGEAHSIRNVGDGTAQLVWLHEELTDEASTP